MQRKNCLVLLTTRCLGLALALVFLLFPGYTRGERVAMAALEQLEAPYVFGESGPERFDCSGLLLSCFRPHGLNLAHSAEIIGTYGRKIDDPAKLMVGDVVCFDTVDDRDPSDHVGVWLGGNAFVHASSGKKKVVVSSLEGYYLEHFTGGRRILCPYF